MNKKMITVLQSISDVAKVKDVGYHEIIDGKLVPQWKTGNGELEDEKWKAAHKKNPVYIESDTVLKEVVLGKTVVVISDVKKDPRSSSEFFFFGIDSILVLPIIKKSVVRGIIVVASIGQIHNFSQEEIEECIQLTEEFLN